MLNIMIAFVPGLSIFKNIDIFFYGLIIKTFIIFGNIYVLCFHLTHIDHKYEQLQYTLMLDF